MTQVLTGVLKLVMWLKFDSITLIFLSFPGFYHPQILAKQSFFYNDSRVWVPVWSVLWKHPCPLIKAHFHTQSSDQLRQYSLCWSGFINKIRVRLKLYVCNHLICFLFNLTFSCWVDESCSDFIHSGDVRQRQNTHKALCLTLLPSFLMLKRW